MTASFQDSAEQPLQRAIGDLLQAADSARTQIQDSVTAVAAAALLDHKTPLFNERALELAANEFNADLEHHWVVFAGDVDDFKQLNSMFPYKEVDIVLGEIGSQLLALAQDLGGRAFRRGGDEFVLVVPQTATTAAQRLGATFTSLSVQLPSGKHPIAVRVSFGSAVVARDAPFADSLARAETACKAAKWLPGRIVVDIEENLSPGWSARPRCPTCRTQVSINGAPDCPRPASIRCPCGAHLPLATE